MIQPTFAQLARVWLYGLCPEHRAESDAWLDYRIVPTLRIGSGASRDDTAAGLRDRQRHRFEEWKSTIDFHQNLIREECARECDYRPVVIVELPEVCHVHLAA